MPSPRFLLSSALLLVCLSTPATALTLTVSETAVEARGITAGGQTVWFHVAQEPRGYLSSLERAAVFVTDGDRNGVEAIQPAGGVALRSIWAVVDLTTGEYALATREGSGAKLQALDETTLKSDSAGQIKQLVRRSRFAEMLLVRPGAGAWEITAGDGGATDEDGAPNGAIQASFDRFKAIATSGPAPKHAQDGDVVIAIDPNVMQAYGVRVRAKR